MKVYVITIIIQWNKVYMNGALICILCTNERMFLYELYFSS